MIDLSHLRLIIVAGRGDVQVDVTIISRAHAQLCVEFIAPSVVRALRNAHDIALLSVSTSTNQEKQKNGDPKWSQSKAMCFQNVTMFSSDKDRYLLFSDVLPQTSYNSSAKLRGFSISKYK